MRVSRDEAERAAVLEDPQGGVPGDGPHLARTTSCRTASSRAPRCPTCSPRSRRWPASYGLTVANVFHAGDGNLHPLVCYDAAVEGQAARAEELAGKILDVCLAAGGSITGEHGVGVDKRKHMAKMFGDADLDAFQALRCAFDPAGLANPGKVMPTPRLCGEVPGPYRQHPMEAAGLAERF